MEIDINQLSENFNKAFKDDLFLLSQVKIILGKSDNQILKQIAQNIDIPLEQISSQQSQKIEIFTHMNQEIGMQRSRDANSEYAQKAILLNKR